MSVVIVIGDCTDGEMTTASREDTHKAWDYYDDASAKWSASEASFLASTSDLAAHVMQQTVNVVALPYPATAEPTLVRAGIFLKRALADFRSVVREASAGYAWQAAALAASAFEHLLWAVEAAEEPDVAKSLRSAGEQPVYSVRKLCARAVERVRRQATEAGRESMLDDLFGNANLQGDLLYLWYVVLCQCKHPTLSALIQIANKEERGIGIEFVPQPDRETRSVAGVAVLYVSYLLLLVGFFLVVGELGKRPEAHANAHASACFAEWATNVARLWLMLGAYRAEYCTILPISVAKAKVVCELRAKLGMPMLA